MLGRALGPSIGIMLGSALGPSIGISLRSALGPSIGNSLGKPIGKEMGEEPSAVTAVISIVVIADDVISNAPYPISSFMMIRLQVHTRKIMHLLSLLSTITDIFSPFFFLSSTHYKDKL